MSSSANITRLESFDDVMALHAILLDKLYEKILRNGDPKEERAKVEEERLRISKTERRDDMRLSVKEAAKLMDASELFVRRGLQMGAFDWGVAIKTSSQYSYRISAEKFEESTGIKVDKCHSTPTK